MWRNETWTKWYTDKPVAISITAILKRKFCCNCCQLYLIHTFISPCSHGHCINEQWISHYTNKTPMNTASWLSYVEGLGLNLDWTLQWFTTYTYTHLYFQLLYHLHLNSTLSRAPVIKCVFCIEVSKKGRHDLFLRVYRSSAWPTRIQVTILICIQAILCCVIQSVFKRIYHICIFVFLRRLQGNTERVTVTQWHRLG